MRRNHKLPSASPAVRMVAAHLPPQADGIPNYKAAQRWLRNGFTQACASYPNPIRVDIKQRRVEIAAAPGYSITFAAPAHGTTPCWENVREVAREHPPGDSNIPNYQCSKKMALAIIAERM